eukprot:maker-scaffold_6-snap-gene-16.21-mRNA-1 protein AED:0.02 eAED:0.02 QI:138/1/1/1/1/1/2/134/204
MTKVAIIYYSMYGHVRTLANGLKAGIEAAGGSATLLQVPETLSEDVLKLMSAPEKDTEVPVVTVQDFKEYDAFIFGMPTRFGQPAAQMKSLWDATGGLWAKGELIGKPAGTFFSTGTQGGGQETTAMTFLTHLVHHGMVYVPLGYRHPKMSSMDEIKGGSPWGPGTYAGVTGGREVSELEIDIAKNYGEAFYKIADAITKGKGE